jgi:tetratricopeptide (TPR) repeat protein
MFGLVGCEKLKISNLQANYHLRKANGFYADESYLNAIDEYEAALELNPNLDKVYLYLGTSYSAMYRPSKSGERNQMYGEKAVEYLLKASEAFPEDEKIIYALGDIYDKQGQFEESEKYYLKILEAAPDKAESFYILANFYKKYNKTDEAKAMYERRIALDPTAQDGYLYYASYGSDMRQWDLSIENHEKRILALYDTDTLMLKNQVEQLKKDIEQVEAIEKNIDTVRKHRSLDKAEKERLIAEAQQRLEKFQPLEEMKTQVEEKEKQIEENLKNREEKFKTLDDELKGKLADAFYTLGVVCWNKSYQSPANIMGPQERIETVDKGLEACNITLSILPEHYDAYAFIGLLWRQKIIAEPLKNDEYMKNWEEAHNKSKELREKKMRREQLKKQLEQMGTEG